MTTSVLFLSPFRQPSSSSLTNQSIKGYSILDIWHLLINLFWSYSSEEQKEDVGSGERMKRKHPAEDVMGSKKNKTESDPLALDSAQSM